MHSRDFLAAALLLTPIVIVVAIIMISQKLSTNPPAVAFEPQQVKRFEIKEGSQNPLTILATTLPQFALNLNKTEFSDLWTAHAQEKEVSATVVSSRGATLAVNTNIDEQTKQLYVTPKTQNQLKPGLYKLAIKIKTVQAKEVTITQDFTWGVLAINTNKATYQVGENVNIGMGVLDDFGDTKCIANGNLTFETAKVWLTVTTPSGKEINLSTDNGTIIGSKDCGPKTVTNAPDFQTSLPANEIGRYKLHMEAENNNGTRSMDDYFTVNSTAQPFDIERSSYPTRIYPKADYPVTITVKANQGYTGTVTDIVPDSFTIKNISGSGRTIKGNGYQTILWNVNWQSGQVSTLSYTITFPQISPEFYIVGPLQVGDYSEGRNWQIASDGLWAIVQEAHATTTSGTTVSATFSNPPGQGHLLIANCYRTNGSADGLFGLLPGGNSMDISAPTGYTTAENNTSSKTVGAVWMNYKIAGAGETSSVTCEKNNSNNTNGPMGIELLEFSGGSSTITLDTGAGSHGNVDQAAGCNTSPFQNTTSSVTQTNNSALLVSAFYATAVSKTFTAHLNSFTDADITGGLNGFNDTGGSYDSAYLELGSPAAKTDRITLNAAGTACANVIATFNTGNNFNEGSFRAFQDADSLTPGTPLAATNATAQLTNNRFRVRLLLMQNSPSGTTLGVGAGNFKLQYAQLTGASCSSMTFSDVTTTSTISYANNPRLDPGSDITSSGNDPSDVGFATRLESYYDDANMSGNPKNINADQNSIATSPAQAGLWDFSLISRASPTSPLTFCLRIVNGDGSTLNTYNNYPKITTVISGVNFYGGTKINGSTKVF